jgi:hypothetical protein
MNGPGTVSWMACTSASAASGLPALNRACPVQCARAHARASIAFTLWVCTGGRDEFARGQHTVRAKLEVETHIVRIGHIQDKQEGDKMLGDPGVCHHCC